MKIIKVGKLVIVLDVSVFCHFCQTTGLFNFVLLASFYKLYKIFLHVCFIVFASLHISLILLY